tara:strand:- start:6 stop:443 length:438 start_codon:yes stop_codon:yes gene_type:complete
MLITSRYRIIAVGRPRKEWIKTGIDLYKNRLPGIIINEIRDSNLEKEFITIKSSIKKDEAIITLNEKGEIHTSIEFSKRLQDIGSQRLAFVIGGANGLSEQFNQYSLFNLSLSPMTLPHDLARLILLEQIYRAQSITQGSPYHRT